jgi:hypothetical protein
MMDGALSAKNSLCRTTGPKRASAASFGMVLALFLGCALAGDAMAQEAVPKAPDLPTQNEMMERLNEYHRGTDLAAPERPEDVKFNATTEAAWQSAWQAYYVYRIEGFGHRKSVFAWQSLSSKIIFVVVLILVFLGMYFAAVQFHVGLRRGAIPPSVDTAVAKADGDVTELELSWKAIRVRSAVLGVIVLALSLAFFYLYLVFVYPIENVF